MNENNIKTIRVELSDNAICAVWVVSLSLVAICLASVFSHYYSKRMIAAFEAGYEETTIPGQPGIAWVKPNKK